MHLVASLVLHALLVTCGLGVLSLIGALEPRSRSLSGSVALLGLGYVCGYAVVFAACIALLVIGVPFTLPTVLGVAAIGSAALLLPLVRTRKLPAAAYLRPASRAEAIGLTLGAIVVILMLSTEVRMALTEWDAWAIWTNKALIFTNTTHLPLDTFTSREFMAHPDYPIGMPLWEAAHFRALGRTDTSHVIALQGLFLVSSLLAAFSLAPRSLSARVSVPAVVGVGLIVLSTATIGYADVPMGLLLMLGVFALARWLSDDGKIGDLRLAVVLLGGAAITKNEGVVGALVLWFAAFVAAPSGRRRPVIVAAVAWAALFLAPWRAWLSAHSIQSDLHLGHALSPGYLSAHADRLSPIFDTLTKSFLTDTALMLIPIALAMLWAFSRPSRLWRFFVIALVLYAAALVLVYWISPYDIAWHLATSASRTFRTLGLFALPAILFAVRAGTDVAERPADTLRQPS